MLRVRFPLAFAAAPIVGAFLASCAPATPAPAEGPAPADTAAAVDTLAAEPADTLPGPDTLAADTVVQEPTGALPPDEPPAEDLPPEEPAEVFGAWADSVLGSLTLREKIGQMIMPWALGDFAPEGSASHDRILRMIEQFGIGGMIMSVGSPTEVAVKLNDLQGHSEVPLLVAADLETGAGFRLRGAVHVPTNIELGGATDFPSLMALGATGDPGLAYEMGRVTAVEALAVGIHVPFAPVLDVNNNAENPIISIRSFGEDPRQVARMGAAFVRGMQEYGAVATGKHFPGHGDTDVDSHRDLPIIPVDIDRLRRVELVPFQAAIDAGMGAIMTAHISVPSVTGNRVPSTLSPAVLDTLLRQEMGFEGLVFTDAMDMRAIDRGWDRQEAAVLAVEAGADVLLMPPSLYRAVEGLLNAVASGRIRESRIDRSVRAILLLKERLGLHRERRVPLEEVPRRVGIPAHVGIAQEIAERSMTVLRNEGELLPLRGTRTANVISVTYHREDDILAGKYFDGMLRGTYPRLVTVDTDRNTAPVVYSGLLSQARRSNLVVVSIYGNFTGRVAISTGLRSFVSDLAAAGIPHVVVSFGNPYVIREFPSAQAYMVAWSGSEVSQRAAVRALLGEIEVGGRLPARVPGYYRIGQGLRIRMRELGDGN